MPVRRKGLSEYKRNFKWRKSDQTRLHSPECEQKCQWAGLRSDEFGISREPSFISRRKVPYYNTQIAKVFEWNGDNDWKKEEFDSSQPIQPLDGHTDHNKDDVNEEKVKTPDAPRLSDKMHSSPLCSRSESPVTSAESKKSPSKTEVHENGLSASRKEDLGKIDNKLNRVLQRKAGMNVSHVSSFPRSSEYQREFVWKTPQKLSPVLAADKVTFKSKKDFFF
ncbi:hypothetical protein lerEdw1_021011 [Lerista edwardsae]|nr:hypothetical protein lerEdw1_021011 [Lerista edwardsae]